MIDISYGPTTNGWERSIALDAMGPPYTLKPANIGKGEQFEQAFLRISSNTRINNARKVLFGQTACSVRKGQHGGAKP